MSNEGASGDGEDVLLAGFYNPKKREEQVLKKLDEELEIFRQLDFTGDINEQLKKLTKDQFQKEKTLESIEEEIDGLKAEVDGYDFVGGHFTKQYRTFQGFCDKLLQQLDSLNHENDEGKKTRRGELIQEIQKVIGVINGRVHKDGKCCPECELYETMWQ